MKHENDTLKPPLDTKAMEILRRIDEERRLKHLHPKQLEAYATKMTKIDMKQGKLKKQGKMWHKASGRNRWIPHEEYLNSNNRKGKNTGKYLGLKK